MTNIKGRESTLYFDCETIPVQDAEKRKLYTKRIKPPGQYKKPESIQKWLDDENNVTEALSKTALDGAWGRLHCIGYAIDNGPLECIYDENEQGMIRNFKKLMFDKDRLPRRLVGHYVKGFDIPFLHKRSIVNGLGPLFDYDSKPWEYNAYCTGEMFSLERNKVPSLDTLCCALGVDSPKDGIDGSNVYDLFKQGKHQEIIDYCKQDVRAVRDIYNALFQAVEP